MTDTEHLAGERDPEGHLSYMGWRIVLTLFAVMTVLYGSALYGFIILCRPLAELHGWSTSQSGSLVSALWLAAPLALVSAPILNRIGAWRLLLIGLLLIAGSFIALTITTEFWQVFLLRLITSAGKVFAVVSIPVIVSQWFSRRFSLAIAAAYCGGSFGGLILAPATEATILALGWKAASLALASLLLIVAAIVAALGRHSAVRNKAGTDTGSAEAEGVRPAWRTQISAIDPFIAAPMALAVIFVGIGGMAYVISAPELLEAYGFSSTIAATLLGLVAAGAMAGNLIAGWTLDRAKVVWTSIGAAAFIAVGLLLLHRLDVAPDLAAAIAAALLIGSGIGACEILWLTLTKRQFGAALFAITYGCWSFCYQAGSIVGTALGGSIFAATSHAGFLVILAIIFAPAIAFSLWRPGMRNEEMPAVLKPQAT
ncbi:MAG: MFS transporter [Sphingopyxis sp.]|nr:MFS transporter [Sphingopyxis sp.]